MFRRLLILVSFTLLITSSVAVFAQDKGTASEGPLLPRPANIYTEQSEAGLPVTLNYYAPTDRPVTINNYTPPDRPMLTFIVGDRDHLGWHTPLINEQGRILDRLLGRLFGDHPDLPDIFPFYIGSDTRFTLTDILNKKLQEPGADWDAKRGRPIHGQFGAVLMAELDKVLQASPIATAFQAHGYTLVLTEIGRIDIKPIEELGGGRYPKYIDIMFIDAVKTSPKGQLK